MKKVILCLLLLSLISCSTSRIYHAEFNPVGRLGKENKNIITLNNPDEVAIYIKSSPEGFTLKENELQIEDGYDHTIIGEININKTTYSPESKRRMLLWGIPTFGYGALFMMRKPKEAKDRTIEALQAKAFEKGANAVIYCVINVSNDVTNGELTKAHIDGYGYGWAVVVNEKYLK